MRADASQLPPGPVGDGVLAAEAETVEFYMLEGGRAWVGLISFVCFALRLGVSCALCCAVLLDCVLVCLYVCQTGSGGYGCLASKSVSVSHR